MWSRRTSSALRTRPIVVGMVPESSLKDTSIMLMWRGAEQASWNSEMVREDCGRSWKAAWKGGTGRYGEMAYLRLRIAEKTTRGRVPYRLFLDRVREDRRARPHASPSIGAKHGLMQPAPYLERDGHGRRWAEGRVGWQRC